MVCGKGGGGGGACDEDAVCWLVSTARAPMSTGVERAAHNAWPPDIGWAAAYEIRNTIIHKTHRRILVVAQIIVGNALWPLRSCF